MNTSVATHAIIRNDILAALPLAELEPLRMHLHRITMVSGQVLHEPNSPIMDVFFVDEGIVSLTASTHDNGRTEVGLTGREGLVGASEVLNHEHYCAYRGFTKVADTVL